MVHKVFLIFGTMVDNLNIEKLAKPIVPGKTVFGPNLGKRDLEWAQNRVFGILFKNFVMLVFLGNNL